MPVRIGFTKFRKEALERELARMAQMFPQLGVQQAILVGDLASGQVGPESSLDLIMVLDIPGKFTRRMDFFTSHLGPELSSNFYVYSPEEFETLKDTNPFLRNGLRKSRTVYER